MTPNGRTPALPEVVPGATEPVLKTILISDLVDSTQLVRQLGDRAATEVFRRHDRLARDLMSQHGAYEVDKTDGFLLLFERPIDAVLYALAYHRGLRQMSANEARPIAARAGIHLAEIWLVENTPEDVARGAKPVEVEGLAKPVCARLMSVASAGQTLLTRSAFDVARRGAVDIAGSHNFRWLAHGGYHLKGVDEPVELFEVGEEGVAPLSAPADSEKVQRVDEQAEIAGWRPAPGIDIPQRPNWQLSERLGEGGFGEVWLAKHRKTGDGRVFKFCYDATSLRSLQREITLLRLLKETLGERRDIVRVLDWDFDRPPYFIEMEHCDGGSLLDWAQQQGGLPHVPLGVRLDIVSQVAEALAAAHSVGVLHKDVKPGNILISRGPGGPEDALQVQLADFGVGLVTERQHLEQAGITALGMTFSTVEVESSQSAGTPLYLAPEVIEGKTPTLRADIYALGVVLFQLVVGDFSRVLAPGWRREIVDPLLADDIAAAVDGAPDERLGDALELATRLRQLTARRQALEAAERQRQEAEALQQAALRWRKRRRWVMATLLVLTAFAVMMGAMAWRVSKEAERANREAAAAQQVTDFLSDLFAASDPFSVEASDELWGRETPVGEVIDRGARRLQSELVEQPEVRARLLGTLGDVYQELSDYQASQPLLEEALAINRRLLAAGEIDAVHHPQVAASLRQLAQLRSEMGQLEDASKLFREALALDRASGDGASLGSTLHDFGVLEYRQGDYDTAEKALAESLEVRRQALGEDHALVATSLHGLAMVHQAAGRYDQADELLEQSLAISRRTLAPGHPRLISSLNNLGMLKQARGDYGAAAELIEEALEASRETLGVEHPTTFSMLNNLAIGRLLQGELEVAEPLTREALEVARKVHGESHPTVATILNNLGFLLHGLGRFDEAEQVYRQSLDMRIQLLGEEHDIVASSYNNLARLFWARGEPAAAEPLIRRALDIFEKTLPADHWRLANGRSLLGGCLLDQGQTTAAEPLIRNNYDAIVAATGEGSPYSQEARQRLQALRVALGHRDPGGD